jgi:teichuronic acid biosynthesis glycosyltransferase TuaH
MADIVYVMNVDWNWIKQRPHFIAEGLNETHDVHVTYQHRYGRAGFQNRKTTGIDISPIYVIPKGDRYTLGAKINRLIKCSSIKRLIKRTNAKCVYLTFPDQVDSIPSDYRGLVVYDCMDNHPAFIENAEKKQALVSMEQRLVRRADIVLASSANLIEKLCERYGEETGDKIALIRNGYNGNVANIDETVHMEKGQNHIFTYFGTVSSWFNFEYILKSLDEFPNLAYEIFGPITGVSIPNHERLIYRGTVEHDELQKNVENVECLIMPFVVNEIIDSVDPVKLYEYINFNKNILCCEYDEVERFSPFVHFYSDYAGYRTAIQEILSRNNTVKYSSEERIHFLTENNWKSRVQAVNKLLSTRGV